MMTAVAKVPQLMVYSDGSRLDEKLPAAEFAKARALMSEAGMPGEMAAVVRPWLISTMLSIPPCEQQRNPIGQLALDPRIGAIAKAPNIPLVGLETIEQLLEAMAAVPDADQIAMLRIALPFAKKREDGTLLHVEGTDMTGEVSTDILFGDSNNNAHALLFNNNSSTKPSASSKRMIPESWILLDSQSTIDVFSSPDLLTGIQKIPTTMHIKCNAGTTNNRTQWVFGNINW